MMELKDIKQYFFAHRNGVAADVLRRAGSPYKTIFGVELPPISALAREIGFDRELAMRLWEDSDVRESRLLAPWLLDPAALSDEDVRRLALSVRSEEDALMLAFRVLKRLPEPERLLAGLETLAKEGNAEAKLSHAALKRHLE